MSKASFLVISNLFTWQYPYNGNERLETLKFLIPLVDVVNEGKQDFPHQQLFVFAVSSSFTIFVMCNPSSQSSVHVISSFTTWQSPLDGNEQFDTLKIIIPLVAEVHVGTLLGSFLLAQTYFTTSVTIVTSHVMGINSFSPSGTDMRSFF
jgi:hypothetical protein